MSEGHSEAASVQSDLEARLRELAERMSANAATLFAYNEEHNAFGFPVQFGLLDPDSFRHPAMLPQADRVAGQIVKGRKVRVARDARTEPGMAGPFAHRERIVASVGCPLVHEDTPVGLLFVSHRRHHEHTDEERRALEREAAAIARILAKSGIPATIRRRELESASELERTLDAIARLACRVLAKPLAIWILDPKTDSFSVRSSTAVIPDYFEGAKARAGDGSFVGSVAAENRRRQLENLPDNPDFPYGDLASRQGFESVLGHPIDVRGRVEGVFEVFAFDDCDWQDPDIWTIERLAAIAGVAIENLRRSEEQLEIAKLTRILSEDPQIDHVLSRIVEAANKLTRCTSSTIVERSEEGFVVARRSPSSQAVIPRASGGLTEYITDRKTAVKIDDTTRDDRVSKGLIADGIRSLIGVPIRLARNQSGALFAEAKAPRHFTGHDVALLQGLADQASIALGWGQVFLHSAQEIEKAGASIERIEGTVEQTTVELQTRHGFDFCAIQLIRKSQNIIETVYGTGIYRALRGRARHYLHSRPGIRDIQAEIAVADPPTIEVLSGWDDRFDRWIYDSFGHDKLVRVFAPLLLVRSEDTELAGRLFERDNWEVLSDGKYRTRLVLKSAHGLDAEIIGTIEAGFEDSSREIPASQALDFARAASAATPRIHAVTLQNVLETIATQAVRILRADSGTIHFLYDPEREKYVYEVGAGGGASRRFLQEHPPRPGGIGAQAIRENRPCFVPSRQGDSENALRESNREIFDDGIRAIAAFPLPVEAEQGVLYVHFRRPHWFSQSEIAWLQTFASRAADAIRHAHVYRRQHDLAVQLDTLRQIALSLPKIRRQRHLLDEIAWSAVNLLAADVVSIYEYTEAVQSFTTPPTLSGHLIEESAMQSEVKPTDVPARLVLRGENVYSEDVSKEPILAAQPEGAARQRPSFVHREGIRSACGVLLKVREETVGVMFVNYRRRCQFSGEERRIIETLGAAAASAIKNSRLLMGLGKAEREIIKAGDPEKILDHLLLRALEITNAEMGEIWRTGRYGHNLERMACKPSGAGVHRDGTPVALGKGLVGAVAESKEPVLLAAVKKSPYRDLVDAQVRSLLAVPLLDGKGRAIGAIVVGSRQPKAFEQQDQETMMLFGNAPVLAMMHEDSERTRVAAETVAALGDVSAVIHETKNHLTAIEVWALGLTNPTLTRADLHQLQGQILAGCERVRGDFETVLGWRKEKTETVDFGAVLDAALDRTSLPETVELETSLTSKPLLVTAARRQLEGIVSTLLQNAIEAMPDGGRICVRTRVVDDRWLELEVSDSGGGISDEEQEELFELRESSKPGGWGLGLWYSKHYLTLIRGQISVESTLGAGSTFTVSLPLAQS